ncbi:hypothetical protein YC2023_034452 [Brassica napus]
MELTNIQIMHIHPSCHTMGRTSILWINESLVSCGQEMDEHYIVMAGEWVCRDEGNWDFVVDKTQMSRKFLVVKRWTSILRLITCGQEMDEHCMVMAGEWICRDERNWDFVVDKTQMSRMVPFRDGITLSKLEQNVMKEFCYGEKVGSGSEEERDKLVDYGGDK